MGKSAINLLIFYPICETICFDDKIKYFFFFSLDSLRVINQNRLKIELLFSCFESIESSILLHVFAKL